MHREEDEIKKQKQKVYFLQTCEIEYLIIWKLQYVYICIHSYVNIMCVCLCFLSPCLFFSLTTYDSTESYIAGLED